MIAIHNPEANFPFCPDQTDFLTFRGPSGFAAVYLELVEGIVANDGTGTNICLSNNSVYESTESVPELIARYAAVKRLRYTKERQAAETPAVPVVKAIIPTETSTAKTPVPSPGSIWSKQPGQSS